MTWIDKAPLAPWTTLKAGGPAEKLAFARTKSDLIRLTQEVHESDEALTILGWGSNVLPSAKGVPGRGIVNQASELSIDKSGRVTASSGIGFQQLFLKAAQAGLKGLEFAVGIPGTLGGALVSNAGAYRGNIEHLLVELEVVIDGEVVRTSPNIMEFSYRDSVLRRPNPPKMVVTEVVLQLEAGEAKAIYDLARENQRQRISKQPPPASAGSFFKNVNDKALAESLDNLPANLKKVGVVPAGYLIEKVGLKGKRFGNCGFHPKHANFMTNLGGASPDSIRRLAEHAKALVRDRFQVEIEEEALYLGDWSDWVETGTLA